MKIKLFLSLLLAGGLMASAQTQGYKDGIEYYKAGQYDNARTILERTLNDANTDKALANYYLGQVALTKGDKALAQSFFDKGLAIDPSNGFNYVGKGALALLNGQEKNAEDYFKEAQKLAKKNHEVIVAIARAYYNADPVKYDKEFRNILPRHTRTPRIRLLPFISWKVICSATRANMVLQQPSTNRLSLSILPTPKATLNSQTHIST